MATTLVEPVAPWLRDLGQVLHNQATANAFIPPADLLVDDDGVTVYMDVPGLRTENLEIELENDVLTVRGERPFPYPARTAKARCAGSSGDSGASSVVSVFPVDSIQTPSRRRSPMVY